MGGNFEIEDGNLDHRPYTSVRKLFYDYPLRTNPPRRNTKSSKNKTSTNSGSSQSSTIEKTIYDGEDEVFLKKYRQKDDDNFLSPISSSIFTGSYSDFYCEPAKMEENNLQKAARLSRSENRLNFRNSNCMGGRVKSLDAGQFKKLSSQSCDDWSECHIYDDTDSCLKVPIDDCPTEGDCLCGEEKEANHCKGQEEDTVNHTNCTRASSLDCFQFATLESDIDSESYWFSPLGLWLDNLPWTKRKVKPKERKQKWKSSSKERKRLQQLTNSYDHIRATGIDSGNDQIVSLRKLSMSLESITYCEENSERTHSSENVDVCKKFHVAGLQSGYCCDGAFGCI